jgi:transposase-like protein
MFNIAVLAKNFADEASAWEMVERMRWPNGPTCPHCGETRAYFIKARSGYRATSTGRKSYRRIWKCAVCRKQYSVLIETIFENTKIPLSKWLLVMYMMSSSKNGVAAYEVHRTLGVTNKTAWYMLHRIRTAITLAPAAALMSGTIMADETYIGGNPKNRHAHDPRKAVRGRGTDKTPVVTMINKETGEARSRVVPDVTGWTLQKALFDDVDPSGSVLVTDRFKGYTPAAEHFAKHQVVDHSADEYVRDGYSTNAVEGFFAQLKTSIDGTHHHVSHEHLDRYVSEFDFRYSYRKESDSERFERLMDQAEGTRLTYKQLVAHG